MYVSSAGQHRQHGLGVAAGRRGAADAEKIVTAFTSLPRVLRLVWDVQPAFTAALGALYIAQGFVPAATAYVSASC